MSRAARTFTPAKSPPLTEKQFQAQVIALAKILGWRVYHPFLSKWSERGFPDLVMVRARDRRLLFAELKSEKGVVSAAQTEWLDLLVAVAYSVEDPVGVGPDVDVFVWRPSDWEQIEQALR